jgi:hypothetical protein
VGRRSCFDLSRFAPRVDLPCGPHLTQLSRCGPPYDSRRVPIPNEPDFIEYGECPVCARPPTAFRAPSFVGPHRDSRVSSSCRCRSRSCVDRLAVEHVRRRAAAHVSFIRTARRALTCRTGLTSRSYLAVALRRCTWPMIASSTCHACLTVNEDHVHAASLQSGYPPVTFFRQQYA